MVHGFIGSQVHRFRGSGVQRFRGSKVQSDRCRYGAGGPDKLNRFRASADLYVHVIVQVQSRFKGENENVQRVVQRCC